MASWEDVRRIANELPESVEQSARGGLLSWSVRDKTFAWERPLRRADLAFLGDAAPRGPVLGVRVPDLGVKEALLADSSGAVFTTPHFDGYPALLVRLDDVALDELAELVVDGWLARAPARLVKAFSAGGLDPGPATS